MELKDKLKKLRLELGLTQTQLAEKLYVSRSTVAKWENGLGLPGKDSMELLEQLFGISREEVATTEPETVIVEKNQKLHLIGQLISWILILSLTAITIALPFAIQKGSYGITPEMAAGVYADSKYIDTGDYRIYYFQFEGEWEDGKHWSDLQGFKPVQKHFWGCTVSEEDYDYRVITKDNYVVGSLHSIKGKHGYYNLLNKAAHYKVEEAGQPMVWDIPPELITASSITIGDTEYPLEDGFFFVTAEPVRFFEIGSHFYEIE